MIVVTYIHENTIKAVETIKGRRLAQEAVENMKSVVRVSSPEAAERMVIALRLSGHRANWYEVE
jgi:uncharacterized protein (UPF0333 family)